MVLYPVITRWPSLELKNNKHEKNFYTLVNRFIEHCSFRGSAEA